MLRTSAGKLVIAGMIVVCLVRGATADPLWAGDRILIDFCDNFAVTIDGSGRQWNQGLNHGSTGTIPNLKNTDGVSTQVGFRSSYWFPSNNAMGLATSALTDYPGFATKDSVFVNIANIPTARGIFNELDTSLTYNLIFYGSRGMTADPRVLQVTIGGVSQSYDAGGTVGEGLVTFIGISPNESGEIVIDFSTPNIGYLGVIELAVPSLGTTATPTFSPDGGPINDGGTVEITCSTPGAEIHYTLDGETPTLQSPLYTSSIAVNPGETLSARAWVPGYSPSEIKSAVYTGKPISAGDRILIDFYDQFTGTVDESGWFWNKGLNHGAYFSSTPGTIQNLKNIVGVSTQVGFRTPNWFETANAMGLATSALTDYPGFATKDSVVLNPSFDPTAQCIFNGLDTSLTYDLTFYGSRGVTADPRVLQVTIDGVSQSYDAGGTVGEGLVTFSGISPNESGEIVIDFSTPNLGYLGVIELAVPGLGTTETPTFSPDGGPIVGSETVTISCVTLEAEIHYTLDGEIPTLESPLYTSPITVNPGETLSARAWAPGFAPSALKTAVYKAYNNPVYIYRADNSVQVDGDLSEWQESEFVPLNKVFYGNPMISSASYAVRWDGSAHQFYVAVKVNDSARIFNDTYDKWNTQDGIEVYLHTTGGAPYNYEETQDSAQQYVLGLKAVRNGTDTTEHVWAMFAGEYAVDREAAGFQVAGVEEVDVLGHPTGWVYYEIRMTAYEYLDRSVPGSSIISPLSAGDIVGVDVVVSDKWGEGDSDFGMMGENDVVNKHIDWRRIGLHKLARNAGDANGDGKVNVGDLGILAANYGRNLQADSIEPSLWWGLGDFNNDGHINVGDLGILAANYGSGTSSFEADYAKVFGEAADEETDDDADSSTLCSQLGLPMIAGLVLMGLMLVKLDE